MKIRVALDARTIYAPTRRGTGKNLVDLYRMLAAIKPEWQFCMLYQIETGEDPFQETANIFRKRVDIPGDRCNFWQDIRLPIAARQVRASVLHCPANDAPWRPLTPTVLTIHDLIPLEIAPNSLETKRWVRRVRRSACVASKILTPSGYSRRAIMEHLAIPEHRITVNHWAPDRGCKRIESEPEISKIRIEYGVTEEFPYILAFGAADPRKNTKGILKAWELVDADIRAHARLIIIGLQPAALDRFQKMAAEMFPDGSCLLHGFAKEQDLTALISGATALCYPSLSEGFGLPILDAFICGTPVITSSTTSLPEVAGDAALLVDPEDPQDIARALKEMLTSPAVRDRLRIAGFARVAKFSWERCAATVAVVLESAANGKRRNNGKYDTTKN
jgi:glycosyltransferase involved in cell wall biosynthesis